MENPTVVHDLSSLIGLPSNPATFSVNPQYAAFQAPRLGVVAAVPSPPTSTTSLSDQDETSDNESSSSSSKKRQRGNYKCSKCGQPKKGHSCPFFPSEGGSPNDPSTPETDNPSGSVGSAPSSAPSSSSAQNLLAMVSSSTIEEQHLIQRIRELEQENYMIHNENYQLRERLIGLGYGNHLAQLQSHIQQSYITNSQQYQQRPQINNGVPVGIVPAVPVPVGVGVGVSYGEASEWDYAGVIKKDV